MGWGSRVGQTVRAPRSVGVAIVLLVVAAGCDRAQVPASGPASERAIPVDRVHAQAQAALDRWAAAAQAGAGSDIAIVGEATGQVGDWEEPVGDNNKPALMAGLVRVAADLPRDAPPPGVVAWTDGTSTPVTVPSAVEALDAIASSATGACDECHPLEVTSARLVTGPVETTRGRATAPIWQFTIQGSRVLITRVAIAGPVTAQPPPWNANNPPVGISIDSAVGLPADVRLVVSFVGAPDAGDKACGADYTAEAVESDLAIVVIVTEHSFPFGGACSAVGAIRTATVQLVSPLGQRAVLEGKEGLPVKVSAR
jgi:hypothetical protein